MGRLFTIHVHYSPSMLLCVKHIDDIIHLNIKTMTSANHSQTYVEKVCIDPDHLLTLTPITRKVHSTNLPLI